MKREDSKAALILKELSENIRQGRYTAKNKFPSEIALSRRFSVSRSLIASVLNELEHQGLVARKQGKGTFVRAENMRRHTIGLIIPGVAVSDFFKPILCEINRKARCLGYDLIFGEVYSSEHDERIHEVRELTAELIKRRVAGVIYEPLVGDDAQEINEHILGIFKRKKIPVVLIDSDIYPFPRRSAFDVVGTDDLKAGAEIAAHLSALGVGKVAFHLPPNGPITYDNRIFGAKAYFREHKPKTAISVLSCAAEDLNALKRHVKRFGRPDAFICMNDAVAATFGQTLVQAGFQVPRDVLLTGFADLPVSLLMTPRLTTVSQNREAIGECALNRLLTRIAEPWLSPCNITLPAKLIVRDSTGKKRK